LVWFVGARDFGRTKPIARNLLNLPAFPEARDLPPTKGASVPGVATKMTPERLCAANHAGPRGVPDGAESENRPTRNAPTRARRQARVENPRRAFSLGLASLLAQIIGVCMACRPALDQSFRFESARNLHAGVPNWVAATQIRRLQQKLGGVLPVLIGLAYLWEREHEIAGGRESADRAAVIEINRPWKFSRPDHCRPAARCTNCKRTKAMVVPMEQIRLMPG